MDNLITVIIPIYNIMDCLPKCVESVCRQTYQNLEILLVDDGSTDGTRQLCDELALKDSRIRVFHKANGGSSSARNLGLSQAKGDFVGFVDSDDWIEPQMYEKLWNLMKSTGMPIAQAGREEVAQNGEILPPICVPPQKDTFIPSEDFLKELLLHKGDCSFCTKLCDRKLFHTRQFPEGILNEDFYLLIHMLGEIEGIASSHATLYHVFYRVGSNTRKQSKEEFPRVFADCVVNADVALNLVEKEYPDLYVTALRFGIFQRLEYLLHIPIRMMKKDNPEYRSIVSFLRKYYIQGIKSPYLTGKNKVYLTLFATAPRTIRRIHKRIRQL